MENQSHSPKITFATFYSPFSQEQLKKIFEKASKFRFKAETLPPLFENWNQYLNIFFHSIQKSHPDCDRVLITDETTQPDLQDGVIILRYPIDKKMMMFEKLRVQIDFLKTYAKDHHVVLLDNDMIVQGDLFPIVEMDFDVGLTPNVNPSGRLYHLPYCNGVLVFSQSRKRKGIEFLEEVKEIYGNEYGTPEKMLWEGEEWSLKKRIGSHRIHANENQILKVDNYRVLILDQNLYNYTSRDMFEMKRYKPDKKILHFKHLRKKDMVTYWNHHLES